PEGGRGFQWKRSLRLVLLGMPLVLVLFILFPRTNLSMFRRTGGHQNSIGFTDRLEPGSVARLAGSDDVAFRAFFRSGFVPPMSRLYWRGAVLNEGNGLTWRSTLP